MVPSGWFVSQLQCLYEFKNGLNADKASYGQGLPFVNIMDIFGSDELTAGTLKGTVSVSEKQKKELLVKNGDVLFNRTSETVEEIAYSAVYVDQEPAVFGGFVIRGRPRTELVDCYFSKYLFKSSQFRREAIKSCQGAVRANIGQKDLGKIEVLLPPLLEQKKIAQILSTWDQAITATERLLENSQQRKKGLMQQLLNGNKRLVNMSGIPLHGDFKPSKSPYRHLPSDWAEVALSNISSFITKGATPTTYGFQWQDSGIPFIRSECVGETGFRASGLAHICREAHEVMGRSKVFNGDILITITGNVGRVCMLPERFEEANINQHIAKITLDEAAVDREFVFQCLQDRKYRVQFERITTGQAYPQISLVQVRDTIIPMPPLHEQRKIALVLSIADQEISALKLRLSALIQEKHALMQQLLTGKRRVQVETEAA